MTFGLPFRCPRRSQPGRLRLVRRPADYTRKLVALLILDDWHMDGSHLAKVFAVNALVYTSKSHGR